GQASVVRVFLAPDATSDGVAALKARLMADRRVASVTNVSPEQALAEASKRPGLDSLASLSATNPFPASLDVRVRVVTQVAAVANSLRGDAAVDPSYPTSYDPDTYSRLRRFALVAGSVAGGILLLLAVLVGAVLGLQVSAATATDTTTCPTPTAASDARVTCSSPPVDPNQAAYDQLKTRLGGDMAKALAAEHRLTATLNQFAATEELLTTEVTQEEAVIADLEEKIAKLDLQIAD